MGYLPIFEVSSVRGNELKLKVIIICDKEFKKLVFPLIYIYHINQA